MDQPTTPPSSRKVLDPWRSTSAKAWAWTAARWRNPATNQGPPRRTASARGCGTAERPWPSSWSPAYQFPARSQAERAVRRAAVETGRRQSHTAWNCIAEGRAAAPGGRRPETVGKTLREAELLLFLSWPPTARSPPSSWTLTSLPHSRRGKRGRRGGWWRWTVAGSLSEVLAVRAGSVQLTVTYNWRQMTSSLLLVLEMAGMDTVLQRPLDNLPLFSHRHKQTSVSK